LTLSITARTELTRDMSRHATSAAAQNKHTDELTEDAVAALIRFFEVLDRWDREAKHDNEIM